MSARAVNNYLTVIPVSKFRGDPLESMTSREIQQLSLTAILLKKSHFLTNLLEISNGTKAVINTELFHPVLLHNLKNLPEIDFVNFRQRRYRPGYSNCTNSFFFRATCVELQLCGPQVQLCAEECESSL